MTRIYKEKKSILIFFSSSVEKIHVLIETFVFMYSKTLAALFLK